MINLFFFFNLPLKIYDGLQTMHLLDIFSCQMSQLILLIRNRTIDIYSRVIARISTWAWANPSWHWARGGVHPGQVWHRDRQPLMLSFIPTGNLESPVSLHVFGLRKPENPERTHTSPWGEHANSPGFKPTTFTLTAAPLCPPVQQNIHAKSI